MTLLSRGLKCFTRTLAPDEQLVQGVTQPLPAFLEDQNAGISTADFEGDYGLGKGLLELDLGRKFEHF